MSCRKFCAPHALAIIVCLTASSIQAADSAEQTVISNDVRLLPQLGGAVLKKTAPTRTQAPPNSLFDASEKKSPPGEFKPVETASALMPLASKPKAALPEMAEKRPALRFVENPYAKRTSGRTTSSSSAPRKPRFVLANGPAAAQPIQAPSLQYNDLPKELRDSLESKIKQRTEQRKQVTPIQAAPRVATPKQQPTFRIKPLAQPRVAQLDDPFKDDPDQTPPPRRPRPGVPGTPMDMGAGDAVLEVVDSTKDLTVTVRRSKLIRTRFDIYRAAVVDTGVCDVVQFTPREVSIIGRGQGATHVTFWFEDGKHKPVTYLVRVVPDPEVQQRREEQYTVLEEVLAEMFPDSKVRLIPVSDKLIVKGQAKGAAEAAQILAIIRGQTGVSGNRGDRGNTVIDGRASDPIVTEASERRLPVSDVINMLRVPGVQQVALRVKIAELNRTAARGFGVDIDAVFRAGSGTLAIQSLLNFAAGGETATSILGSFSNDDIQFGIRYLQQKGVIRVISEPTLVTMSGREASFIAGGEFAVPTTVGVGGASAVTTDFRAFGAIINFLPIVLDKDHIRLQVSPEFSKVNEDLAVDGTPGLDTRSVTTTVELREGQTLAIAGLLEDTTEGDRVSDLPLIGHLVGRRNMKRTETELIIIVTPELVHPMDPEEVPPLPGFDVTEPNDGEFFIQGRLEGRPTINHRSTVWPSLRRRYQSGGDSMISGPFGHGQ